MMAPALQVPDNICNVLREAHRFFKQEHVPANTVLMDTIAPSEKLFFIGTGSVELQVFERTFTGLCV